MKTLTKKELKNMINEKGFFAQLVFNTQCNAPLELQNSIPEGATYFEGIASNGELNRNGYIIRPEAWTEAIDGYFVNPIILLMHEINQPIGKALSARVTDDGLVVNGYIFDELTGNKFSKGLYSALSTGHFTQEVEFENTVTGQILSANEFMALPFSEQMSEDWVMAVTKLDWVEFSLVTIGSNKKSIVTHKNAIMAYLKNNENEQQDVEITEEVTTEGGGSEESVSENETEGIAMETEDTTTETPENEGENPESTEETTDTSENEDVVETVEGVQEETQDQNKVKISKEQHDRLKSASKALLATLNRVEVEEEKVEENQPDTLKATVQERAFELLSNDVELKEYFANMVEVSLQNQNKVNELTTEVMKLKEILASIPDQKGMVFSTQDKTVSVDKVNSNDVGTPIVNLLREKGAI